MLLKSLKVLLSIAETGSFIAAARELNTVQSNVTTHVKKLESELGCKLFDRDPHRTVPTAAGLQLLDYAQKMLSLHDKAIKEFKGTVDARSNLRVGTMETTAATRLPAILGRFHKRHPEVEIELAVGCTGELNELLLAGKLDCAFVASNSVHGQLFYFPAFSEKLVLVTSKPYQSIPGPEKLMSTTFLAFPQGCRYRQRIELLLNSLGLTTNRISDFGSLDAILGCVASGMGFSILPEAAVRAQLHRLGVYVTPLPQDLSLIYTYFAAKQRPGWSPSLKAFFELISESANARERLIIKSCGPPAA